MPIVDVMVAVVVGVWLEVGGVGAGVCGLRVVMAGFGWIGGGLVCWSAMLLSVDFPAACGSGLCLPVDGLAEGMGPLFTSFLTPPPRPSTCHTQMLTHSLTLPSKPHRGSRHIPPASATRPQA